MKIAQLFIHPIKGFTAVSQSTAILKAGEGMPGDRTFAFHFVDESSFTPGNVVHWLSKSVLVCQNDWPGLAALRCDVDFVNNHMKFYHKGDCLIEGRYTSEPERQRIASAISDYLGTLTPSPSAKHPKAGRLVLLGGPGSGMRFPDREKFDVSLLSLNSLYALEHEAGVKMDIRSFRGNLILDELNPWEEMSLIGKKIQLGSVILQVNAPIGRCFNVNVSPDDGEIQPQVLATLAKLQRGKFGVLANVIQEGKVEVGDRCTVMT